MSSSSSKKGDLALVMEIESGKVRGTLVRMEEGSKPLIAFSFPCDISSRPNTPSGLLVKSTMSAVDEIKSVILRFLSKNAEAMNIPRNISAVYYALSYPWIISESKTISVDFHEETTISRRFVTDIIEDEGRRFADLKGKDMVTFEKKVFDVKLNGYSVSDWDKKRAKNLEVSVVVSLTSKNMIERLEKVFEPIVSKNLINFHSRLLLENIAIKNLDQGLNRYVLVFPHAELTEVAVFHRNSCLMFGSFPFGTRTAQRKLSNMMKIDENTASSLYSMHFSNHLDPGYAKPIKKIIDKVSLDWRRSLSNIVGEVLYKETSETIILRSIDNTAFFESSLKDEYPMARVKIFDAANHNLVVEAITIM